MNLTRNISTIAPATGSESHTKLIHPAVHLLGQPLNPTNTNSSSWINAWHFHVIFFSICYSILSIYAIYGIIRSYNRKEKVTRILAYIIHALIFLFGISRLFTLSVFHNVIVASSASCRSSVLSRVVFGVGFPCITAAFGLVQFSFTEALKGRLSESKLGNFKFIGFLITGHFLVVLTVEILTTLLSNLALLFFATKSYFLLMTAMVMIRILYSGYKVLSQASENKRALHHFSVHYGTTKSAAVARRKSVAEKDLVKSLRKVKTIVVLTSLFSTIICIMEIYSICELAEILAGKDGALAPWPWYAYQTAFRLAELGMAGTVLYTLSPPGQARKISDKVRSIWNQIFGSTEKTDKIEKGEKDDGGNPVAMLNRAYDLGNDD